MLGANELQAADVSVTPTAVTVANVAIALPTTAATGRKSLIVFNNAAAGGQTVFVGGSGVTTSSGIPVAPQTSLALDVGQHVGIFGIAAAATPTADVRVLEIA